MADLSDVELTELTDAPGRVYLWRIPEEWPAEKVNALGDEINPRFDHAYHLFASEGATVEDVTDQVEIAEAADAQ